MDDASRAQLFRRAIVAGGAIVGGIATWGLPELTSAASKEQDARVLNLALALEYTEAAFYQEALDAGGLQGDLKEYAQIVLEHEKATSRSSSRRWAAQPNRRRATSSGGRRGMPRRSRRRR